MWIFLSVCLVLLVISPGFRFFSIRAGIVCLVFAVVAGLYIWWSIENDKGTHRYTASYHQPEAKPIEQSLTFESIDLTQIENNLWVTVYHPMGKVEFPKLGQRLTWEDLNPKHEEDLPDGFTYKAGDKFFLHGRIKNKSDRLDLLQAIFKVVIKDCVSLVNDDSCDVVAEAYPIFHGTSVPVQQARDVNIELDVEPFNIKFKSVPVIQLIEAKGLLSYQVTGFPLE